ncbi:AraC-type DNA-binding protein [Lachnospiraceae bacterium C7]|nr:AraC-type DNA-binding protein [Lachnospiraceae bacterium C7]
MHDIIYSIFPQENFIDLSLYQYGWELCEPLHLYGPAKRNHFLFHYVISGAGTLTARNKKGENVTYRIKSGQGFLLYPGQEATYMADKEHPWEYTWLEFDGLKVKESLDLTGFSLDNPIYHSVSKDLQEKTKNEMLYIVNNNTASVFHLMGHLYLFFDFLIKSMKGNSESLKSNTLREFYMKESISFVEQNFQNNITIEDLAENVGLNRSYFSKIFKKSFGQPPQLFLMNYRMSKATELLRMTNLSIADIGDAVGYPNQLHFSRTFKNVYGISPRQWRNAHCNH